MTREKFYVLLEKYKRGRLTEAERKSFMLEIARGGYEHEIKDDIGQFISQAPDQESPWSGEREQKQLDELFDKISENRSWVKRMWPRSVAAAVLLIFVSAAVLMWYPTSDKDLVSQKEVSGKPNDLFDGKEAILTLEDGSTVVLGEDNQVIAQSSAAIRQQSGRLAYSDERESGKVSYNTLTTPRGKQFEILFSDGSRVWLNSASSLRYPTSFADGDRVVELHGQGYFEIARQEKKPFRVMVDDMEVEVLGTHFDIKAYPDDNSVNTTLLEGKVKVKKGSASKLLAPGDQAVIGYSPDDMDIMVRPVEASQVIAWKNGLFLFNNTDLPSILREVERWYDVDIVNPNEASNKNDLYGGSISRSQSLPEVLRLLEANGPVHFKITGKTVQVLPGKNPEILTD